jgi:aminopeptidase N
MSRQFLPLAAIILAAAGQRARAQSPPRPVWQILSLDLDVAVAPETRTLRVSGTARIRLSGDSANGPTLAFGPGGVKFDSAAVSLPAVLAYSSARDSLVVNLRSAVTHGTELTVSFAGHADRDLGRSLIRAEGAMISWGALWYPILAWHRDSVPELEFPGTTRITVPARWRTLSPGVLVDSSRAGENRTEVWRVHRPTARSFVAAEFVPAWMRVDSSLVAVYVLSRHAHRIQEYGAAIPRMVRTLSSFFGPYPFATFGIAELPREVSPPGFGGRSEPGYFVAHTDALEGEGINVSLFAHELTHMWFPNAVDSRPPGDDMMDEAIATYGVALYREVTEGTRSARRELVEGSPDFSMRAYFHYVRMGADEPLMSDYSPGIARAKGPLVYDMLRRRVGDSVFFDLWRDLAARGGSVSLADLRRFYLERAPSDTGLAAFLSQWMDRKGAPIIEVTQSRPGRIVLTQRGAPYELDVPVRLYSGRSARDTVVHLSRRHETFRLGSATRIELDPGDELLLWKPRFGPPPHAAASWPVGRWRTWLAEEIAWLMRGYEVQGVAVSVVRNGRVVWSSRYGRGAPSALASSRALVDSMRAHGDTGFFRQLTAAGELVSLALGRPNELLGVVVHARGGWGGRQLAMHVAQRVAIQYRWSQIPR